MLRRLKYWKDVNSFVNLNHAPKFNNQSKEVMNILKTKLLLIICCLPLLASCAALSANSTPAGPTPTPEYVDMSDVAAPGFTVDNVKFFSNGTELNGSVVMPKNSPITAAVVFVHGSGETPRDFEIGYQFAAEGIAALVYDKRGVGQSQGEYELDKSVGEDNLNLLADDAAAALNALKHHPKLENIPVGLTGISQAGWIVPLAAEKNDDVDFILLWSGPVTKVSEEDIFSMHNGDQDSENVSTYQEAVDGLDFDYEWPTRRLGKDTDPQDSLRNLSIPGFWIFGAYDGSIPVDLSAERLDELVAAGQTNYSYVIFPNFGHNNLYPTFDTAVEWINEIAQEK